MYHTHGSRKPVRLALLGALWVCLPIRWAPSFARPAAPHGPVLTPAGASQAERFDSAAVGGAWVQVPQGVGEPWRMLYHGRSLKVDPQVVPLSMGSLGLAESTDGLAWRKVAGLAAGESVLAPDEDVAKFDSALVGMGSIVGERLYYFGGCSEPFEMGNRTLLGVYQSIGVAFDATAEQGHVAWAKRREVFPRGPPGSWDEIFAASPQVVRHGPEDWRMYYHGAGRADRKFRIGLATSTDGLVWSRAGVILEPGETGSWDSGGCSRRHVFAEGSGYMMLYEASSQAGGHAFGLAESSDGLEWKKVGSDPVFLPSVVPGAWDGKAVSSPHFVPKSLAGGDDGLLFYVGLNAGGASAIGIARAEGGDLRKLRRATQ